MTPRSSAAEIVSLAAIAAFTLTGGVTMLAGWLGHAMHLAIAGWAVSIAALTVATTHLYFVAPDAYGSFGMFLRREFTVVPGYLAVMVSALSIVFTGGRELPSFALLLMATGSILIVSASFTAGYRKRRETERLRTLLNEGNDHPAP
ncbi:hypothetical protein HNP84_004878 [Thermocatellispora tengchongensis]|uniref:Uncharacterized protein n=1 Tax=Thermocatellispora tengchongensis TaxID=1073253 RepID=A0A840P749_9ACTN|nr:hypothetical protein [Thermocatellispora tengchongensis]MBB5135142.1 hypothetical protein [Thermocatellispora tengchongensis]